MPSAERIQQDLDLVRNEKDVPIARQQRQGDGHIFGPGPHLGLCDPGRQRATEEA